jgi:hypothetical protein
MGMIRPRLYYNTAQEMKAWETLLEAIKEKGVLTYANTLSNPTTGAKTTEESSNGLSVELTATSIQTKEELIAACQINTDEWEVANFRVSTWTQKEDGDQLYAVKCTFKRVLDSSFNEYIKRLEKGLTAHVRGQIKHVEAQSENVTLINIFDAHIDKVCRAIETGEESTIEDNCNRFREAVDYLLLNIGSPELIIFPVGNDLFNVNDCRGTTKKGTHQETTTYFIDAFEIGLNLISECIDKMAAVAPVYVPIIAGNHAEDLENILGVALKALYSKTDTVEVEATRIERKYRQFGLNLFMFAHGDKSKNKIKDIPSIMAVEKPDLWASSAHRFAIFGDIHHEQTHELNGVTAMFLRSMSSQDKWHHSQGYVGSRKTAYAMTYSKCGRYTNTSTINF